MSEQHIASIFQVQNRFIRSVHLERDFSDPSSLDGYVLTPLARETLRRLEGGLAQQSSQRAWRLTGDYGSGKSSFALLLARVFGGRSNELPSAVRSKLDGLIPQTSLLPVLVTSNREPLSFSLLRALSESLRTFRTSGPIPRFFERIEELRDLAESQAVNESEITAVVSAAVSYVAGSGRMQGLLLIFDELGKSLEYSALHSDRQDIYLLQRLAEIAARSGQCPIFVVGLLHQGFSAYSASLSQTAQKEWEKVAGRFDEVLFSQPLEQIATLTAHALKVRSALLKKPVHRQASVDMKAAIEAGWYGAGIDRQHLIDTAPHLYPIHPSLLPALVRLFSRFGQNERSLFSFLLSNEPFGLQSFAQKGLASGEFYRLHNLFDYARAAFGHRLGLQSYRSHWNHIDSVIDSYSTDRPEEIELLKTIGLLNLLDSQSLVPSAEALTVACGHPEAGGAWMSTLEKLHRQKGVVYFRGRSAGYCLWPHTSVNLERAYEDAARVVNSVPRVSVLLSDYVQTTPVVARRHYIQTGNLRHFSVRYCSIEELDATLNAALPEFSDGRILVALCDTEEERRRALTLASQSGLPTSELTLVAVPRPLNVLAGLVQEVQRWQWVVANTPELIHDRYAFSEVSQQLTNATLALKKAISQFVAFQQGSTPTDLLWFRTGKAQSIRTGRQFLSLLSDICDHAYRRAPRIRNELVNRQALSSAAAAARMRLIARIFSAPDEPKLGMDPTKKPPEMSMYLSVLVAANLHRQSSGSWMLSVPAVKNDPCNIIPTMDRLLKVVRRVEGKRVRISELLSELRRPPYGVRDGLGVLLLAIFAQVNERDLAFYERGSFMRKVSGEDFLRIVKDPDSFDVQYYELNSVRSELFRRLLLLLHSSTTKDATVELLDVVRALCQFAAQLPIFAQKTSQLAQSALEVRAALLSAREPATLIFKDLPRALAFEPDDAVGKGTDSFVAGLQDALEVLRLAYPNLLSHIDSVVGNALNVHGAQHCRGDIQKRAEALLKDTKEPRLRAFCLRLADTALEDQEWLESVASLSAAKPPSKWIDRDVETFSREIAQLANSFRRLEALMFSIKTSSDRGHSFRVAITQQDGSEYERVFEIKDAVSNEIRSVEAKIMKLVRPGDSLSETALAEAFWNVFGAKGGVQ